MQEPPILTRDHLSDSALQENRDFQQEDVSQSLKRLLQVQRDSERHLCTILWFVVAIFAALLVLLIVTGLSVAADGSSPSAIEMRGFFYSY